MAASNVIRRVITCNSIARPVGPYSHAVIVGQTMYVSGSIGMDKEGQLVPGGIKEQTRQALENVKAILSTGGCQLGNGT
jgi:2-iminobutanoate/2-iminopropanoate deaminase